jgi:DNA-directed RNA polymerase subunit L
MFQQYKIKVLPISYSNTIGDSRLEFKISGKNINYIIVNTLRRAIFTYIPIYAFTVFKFEENTSIFHNNFLKLRFNNMPVWGIENTIDFIENDKKKNIINEEVEDENDKNKEDELEFDENKVINSSSLKQITMYVNYINKTRDIVTVTTNDAKFYYEEKQIASPYTEPIAIIKLQPNQKIAFSAISTLGTEQEHTMYSAVCVTAYKEINEEEFDFFLESRGQIIEKRIIIVAIINIIKRLNNFVKLLSSSQVIDEDENGGLIIINNEDHTLGNLISRGMQQHKGVHFAGYNLPHPLAKKVHFHYKLNKGMNIKSIIDDVVTYYITIFNTINELINTNLN